MIFSGTVTSVTALSSVTAVTAVCRLSGNIRFWRSGWTAERLKTLTVTTVRAVTTVSEVTAVTAVSEVVAVMTVPAVNMLGTVKPLATVTADTASVSTTACVHRRPFQPGSNPCRPRDRLHEREGGRYATYHKSIELRRAAAGNQPDWIPCVKMAPSCRPDNCGVLCNRCLRDVPRVRRLRRLPSR